jgi:hypothetical protein
VLPPPAPTRSAAVCVCLPLRMSRHVLSQPTGYHAGRGCALRVSWAQCAAWASCCVYHAGRDEVGQAVVARARFRCGVRILVECANTCYVFYSFTTNAFLFISLPASCRVRCTYSVFTCTQVGRAYVTTDARTVSRRTRSCTV